MTLSSAATELSPGGEFVLNYQIDNFEQLTQDENLLLSVTAPEGFVLKGAYGGQFFPETVTETFTPSEASGQMVWIAGDKSFGPYFFTAVLTYAGEALAADALTIEEEDVYLIGLNGGVVTNTVAGITITVDIPGGAVEEPIDLRILQPSELSKPPYALSPFGFQLTAMGRSTDTEITEFLQEIRIEIAYDPAQLDGDESGLHLYYYDESAERWSHLVSRPDAENDILIGYTDHFSDFDIDVETWQSATLPTTENFQVAAFTGAATYSYSFWVPPGPGGLQPSLSLSYSSQTVDSASVDMQASWVGMGWSLETGYVVRNMNGTFGEDDLGDDTFSIVVNGVSSLLIPIEDTLGNVYEYRMADETFWRVRFYTPSYTGSAEAPNTWVVWDKSGNVYRFGEGDNAATYPIDTGMQQLCDAEIWNWPMTSVENAHGQVLAYDYFIDTDAVAMECSQTAPVDIAVYPDTITYPHGKYRVKFNRAGRDDYDEEWGAFRFFQRYKLANIQIQHNPGGTWNNIRTFTFTYNDTLIFPGFEWSGTHGTLALTALTQTGLSGASYPAVTFTYDNLHLVVGDNGYGGIVEFEYDAAPWYELDAPTQREVFQNIKTVCRTSTGNPTGWSNSDCYPDDPENEGNIEDGIRFTGVSTNATLMDDKKGNFQPGAAYQISVTVYSQAGGGTIKLGFWDGDENVWSNAINLAGSFQIKTSNVLYLDADADEAAFSLKMDCSQYCIVQNYTLTRLPVRYRVIEKAVHDAGASSPEWTVYTYTYDEPATNDAAHSNLAATIPDADLSTVKYAEFRGHASVSVTNPDGLVTTSWFHQDDTRKGQVYQSLTTTQEFKSTFESGSFSGWTTVSGATIKRSNGDNAVELRDTNPSSSTWAEFYRASHVLSDGEMAMFRFKAENANTVVQFGLDAGTFGQPSFRSFSVRVGDVDFDGLTTCADEMVLFYQGTGSLVKECVALSAFNFVYNDWYNVLFLVDDDHLRVLIWPENSPAAFQVICASGISGVAGSACPMSEFAGNTWRTHFWGANNGSNTGIAWVDEYREGVLYALTATAHVAVDSPDVDVDLSAPGAGKCGEEYEYGVCEDLKQVIWTRTSWTAQLTFEGNGESIMTGADYLYDAAWQGGTQYGNQTGTEVKQWNNTTYSWDEYSATRTEYKPNTTNWIVGLPARTTQYKCSGTACTYSEPADWIGQTLYIYDTNTGWNTAPSIGNLAAQRVWVDNLGGGGTRRYAQTSFAYDGFGNQTSITTYTGYGTETSAPTSGAQTTVTDYNDAYDTYPLLISNPLGDDVVMAYDYQKAVPTSITDANGNTTSATYDGLGRMTTVCKSGDSCDFGSKISFDFKLDGSAQGVYFAYDGTAGTGDYLRMGLYPGGGNLNWEYFIGTSRSWANLITGYQVDTWYTAEFTFNANGEYRIDVWKKTTPGTVYTKVIPFNPSSTPDWTFQAAWVYGNGYLDNYAETVSGTTVYTQNFSGGSIPSGWTVVSDPSGTIGIVSGTLHNGPSGNGQYGPYVERTAPVEEDSEPSIVLQYFDAGNPYMYTTASQKVDENTTLTVKKFYNGLGQLVQTQLLGATLVDDACGTADGDTNPETCDILVFYEYDPAGRLWKQSVPFAYENANGYRDPDTVSGEYYAETTYDDLGRPLQQEATNGSTQASYGYGLIPGNATEPFGFTYTTVTNADGVITWSLMDPLGRTTEVRPAVTNSSTLATLGPWMFYEYDELGRLIKAHKVMKGKNETEAYKTTVILTYDVGGRKTAMDDPDMGYWTYAYDALGQLTSQTDARSCTLSFTYDLLGRPLTKGSTGTCSEGGGQVTYYYDDYTDTPFFDAYTGPETNAIGRRTGMDDDSGFTYWTYDNRGRLIEETKSITGYEDLFVTGWAYNNGDQLTQMTYPLSEEAVEFEYLPQGLPKTVDSADGDYLVGSTYDASGRLIEQLFRSAASPMKLRFDYWAWDAANNGLGRLKRIQATESGGTLGDLLDIYYGNSGTSTPGYDAVGNITRIETDTPNNYDDQLYGYDDLDRLTSWQKCTDICSGTTTYSYDDYGRLNGLPDPGTYTYYGTTSSYPFHAVDSTSTSDDFHYDANGNMTLRDVNDDEFDFAYDRDNRLVEVTGDAAFTFVYDGDGNRVKASDQTTGEVTYYIGNYFEVTVSEEQEEEYPYCSAPAASIPDNNTNGVDDTITISNTGGSLTDLNVYLEVDHTKVGQLIVTLEHESTSTVVTLMDRPGHPTPGMCTGDNIDGLFNDGETATAEGSCVSMTPALSGAFDPNGNLSDFNSESLNGNWTLNVSDRGSGDTGTLVSWCLDPTGPSGIGGVGSEPLAAGGDGKLPVLASALPQHHFSTGIFSLAQWLARWVLVQWQAHVAGLQAVDIHSGIQDRILASQSPTGGEVWKSYYYAGGQRIAMRVQDPGAPDTDADYYLLGDHLGSTTVTANEIGEYHSETRYNPWGEEIYNSGARPTDYTYTGQYSHAEDFNLLYYVARFYDPYLGHFTQADTILPDPGNPQAFDRYAYSLNNPVNYTDPSGHRACSPEEAASGDETCDQVAEATASEFLPTITTEILNDRVKQELKEFLKAVYNWTIKGSDWTISELRLIAQAGAAISSYVEGVIGSNGNAWIRSNLSAVFRRLTSLSEHFVFGNTVNLTQAGLAREDPVYWIVHEMGHVFDNKSATPSICPGTICFGGGYGDQLISDLGGEVAGGCSAGQGIWGQCNLVSRRLDGAPLTLDLKYQFLNDSYANDNTTEYFATVFALSVMMRPGELPHNDLQTKLNTYIASGTN